MHLFRKLCAGTVLLTAGCLLTSILAWAATKTTRSVTRRAQPIAISKPHVNRRPSVRASARATAKTGTTRKRSSAMRRVASRNVPWRQRFARLRLESGRVTEIQQALGQAGYLKQEPSGNWDEATRDAMRRFQADHGFPNTGMPEAKSLLKLGLGPHPLPPELDTSSPSQAPESENANPSPSSLQTGAETSQVPPPGITSYAQ